MLNVHLQSATVFSPKFSYKIIVMKSLIYFLTDLKYVRCNCFEATTLELRYIQNSYKFILTYYHN